MLEARLIAAASAANVRTHVEHITTRYPVATGRLGECPADAGLQPCGAEPARD